MAVKFCYGVGIDMLRGRITFNTIYFRNYFGDKARFSAEERNLFLHDCGKVFSWSCYFAPIIKIKLPRLALTA